MWLVARSIKVIILSTLLLHAMHNIHAQEQFVETIPPSKYITSIPFTMLTGGVVLIRAKLNDYPDSLNFILDTGSGGISLDSTTVEEFRIPTTPSDKTIRGIGGIKKVSFFNNGALAFPGLKVERLNFHVNDYEILSSVYGIRIDGIIGYSFFSRYIVSINYDEYKIHVYSLGNYAYPREGHILRPMFTALPIQHSYFTDSKRFFQRFYLDTGAGLSFLLSERYIKDSAVLRKKKKEPFLTQAEGLGGKMSMRLTTVREVRIGPYRFRKVPTLLFSDDYNVTSYPHVGGLIGNDLLRRFNITFNYTRQEVHIVPNSHYRDLFDYAYTGLSIYYTDGKIFVDDVVPGSPADKAGLKKDDVVIAVNNNMSNNIQTYKAMMQSVHEKINIVVSREGKLMEVKMRPVSIL